jgi:site-specific DNA recombinase
MPARKKFQTYTAEEGDPIVIYARYSSDKQNEQSIEGQLRFCHEYAEHRGFRVVGEYIDRALSGTDAERRPEFQKMISDASSGAFRFIVVWKLDRFARNRYDSAIYKQKLSKFGVKVLSATEGVGEGDESIILEAVLEAMAETYSRQLSQNVRRGMHETALKGNSVGGDIPLGYRVINKKLVVDEREAEIVRYAFEHYAAGETKGQISAYFNERGYHTRRGNKFDTNSFSRMFTNEKYIGVFHYNGEVSVDGGCPALVSKELFYKCSRRCAAARRAPAHNRENAAEYLLQGKLFCGPCGSSMVGESGKSANGSVYHYYACSAKKKLHTCKKKNEKKGFLEWYITEQVCLYVLAPERISYIADRVVSAYNSEFDDNAVSGLDKRLKAIDKELDKVTDAIINARSKAIVDRMNERADALEQERADVEIDLARLRVANGIKLKAPEVEAYLRQFCKGDPLDEAFQRRIIDAFINAIYLYDDKIIMYFNVKGGEQVSYMEMLSDTDEPGVPESSDLLVNGSP